MGSEGWCVVGILLGFRLSRFGIRFGLGVQGSGLSGISGLKQLVVNSVVNTPPGWSRCRVASPQAIVQQIPRSGAPPQTSRSGEVMIIVRFFDQDTLTQASFERSHRMQ